jgi:hypothetical protein
MVAIPVFVVHRILLSRVDGLVAELEEASLDLGELICPAATIGSVHASGVVIAPPAESLPQVHAGDAV